MNLHPIDDGVTHLNVYSRGRTELGRFLSNFARCPIETEDGHFESVEGYWGWLSISEGNPRRDELRSTYGFRAKSLKDELYRAGDAGRRDPRFSEKIASAIHAKCQTKEAIRLFSENEGLLSLPIVHYYAYEQKRGGSINVIDITDKYPEFVESVRKEVDAYLTSSKNSLPELFGVRRGVVCQQVNCQNTMGAGLARAIYEQFPNVKERYHDTFKRNSKESLFGKVDIVKLSDELYVANIYSQFYYGNPAKTGKVYTDAEKLARAVDGICKKLPDLPVYLPHTKGLEGSADYGIGCGYGGESWEKLSGMFASLGHDNLHLIDTKTGRVHELGSRDSVGVVGLKEMEKLTHTKQKYPPCIGMSEAGIAVEQYCADLAAKYSYKPLPSDARKQAIGIYLANLPKEFDCVCKAETKGGVEIPGKNQPVVLKDGTKIAERYNRIVVGNYGAFIEIDGDDCVKGALRTKEGEEYRESEKYKGSVKYFWKTAGDTGAKVYEQRGGVDYADYKPGKYYISPYEVMGKEEVIAAGMTWTEEFTTPKSKEKQNQVSVSIDPSLYEGRPVVFDLETTGFSAAKGDEILQIAIVNELGEEILNVYTDTLYKKYWPDAEAVHHITPKMVEGAPHASSYSEVVSKVFEKASLVVGHNIDFDRRFVKHIMGVDVEDSKVIDTCSFMKKDATIIRMYTKFRLEDAMRCYCPELLGEYKSSAHNALTDAKATAAVFRAQDNAREMESHQIEER